MTPPTVHRLLADFRRGLLAGRLARWAVTLFFAAGIFWMIYAAPPNQQWLTFGIGFGLLSMYIVLAVNTTRISRKMHTGSVLLAAGQLDNAETWLRQAMTDFSLSTRIQLVAGQSMAAVYFHRDAYLEVIAICRLLLRYRVLQRLQNVWVTTRLLLTESLLSLNRMDEAYEAMRPLYDTELTLNDRLKLLPLQLRYELAADHHRSAVHALGEKVQLAELLDARQAALAHALLAEACRRQGMGPQQALLTRRARLYHDLEPLAAEHRLIAPLLEWPDLPPDKHDSIAP